MKTEEDAVTHSVSRYELNVSTTAEQKCWKSCCFLVYLFFACFFCANMHVLSPLGHFNM